MLIEICSFGNKYGQPSADLILDVRCLENPFWVPELREKSGLEQEVQAYILRHCKGEVERLLEDTALQVAQLQKEEKDRLRIAVGCTGGRHRSVCVAQLLCRRLEQNYEVKLNHRDIDRG